MGTWPTSGPGESGPAGHGPAGVANIYLVGLMGSGKTTVAGIVAARLGWRCVDTDALAEARAGRSIPQIFAVQGEAAFRRLEHEVLSEVAGGRGQVVATGGGIVLLPENRRLLRDTGFTVYLEAPPEELYRRLSRGRGMAGRPLLAVEDPLARLRALQAEREHLYREVAHAVVSTRGLTPGAVAERVLRACPGAAGAGSCDAGAR